MKRYFLFIFTAYEGAGGWESFVDSFDTKEQAQEQASTDEGSTNAHIVDGQS
jgi:hypothetical protein